MTEKKTNRAGLDRRQFVKGAVASTAAVSVIPVGQACALIRNAQGRAKDWVCRIAVIDVTPLGTLYEFKNCRTGATWRAWDVNGLALGNCANPQAGGCFEQEIWDRFERVQYGEFELVLLPNLSERQKRMVRRNVKSIAKRYGP